MHSLRGPGASALAGAAVGALLGTQEAVALYALGDGPLADAVWAVGFDSALLAVVGAGLSALPRPWQRGALLLAVAGLQAARGPSVESAVIDAALRGLSVALATAWLYHDRRQEAGWGAYWCAAWLVTAIATLALAQRVCGPELGRLVSQPTPRTGALLAVAIVHGAALGRGARPLAALGVSALAALAIGVGFGNPSRPPRSAAATAGARPGAPSILLVTLDTLRADHVSAYGYPRKTTPRLDALARRSTLFERAYASSPYTLSTHASLFTGLLPSAHGAHPVPFPNTQPGRATPPDYPLDQRAPTLAERLAQLGYRTGAVAANHGYLGRWTGLSRGFGTYDCRRIRLHRYAPLLAPFLLRASPRLADRFSTEATRRADAITDRALRWVDSAGGAPFFLFLNYYDPHYPYAPPAPWDRRFLPDGPVKPIVLSIVQNQLERGSRRMAPQELAYLLAQYDGEIGFMDSELGRLLDGLEQRGLLEGMLVIVTSDHGEFFGEHGLFQHERALYEEVLRVPLLVKRPRQQQPLRVATRIGLHQVPRFVEALALDPGAADPWSQDAGFEAPRLVAEYWTTRRLHRNNAARFGVPAMRALYDERYKLIQMLGGNDELYDLQSDPGETRNRLHEEAAARERLGEGLAGLALKPRSDAVPLRPEALEELRALGYLN